MPYCVTGFSLSPTAAPNLAVFNPDGSEFIYPKYNDGPNYGTACGFKITETTVPSLDSIYKFAKQTGSLKSFPDFFPVLGQTCVSQKMKDQIEMLEPGVHQFFPLTIVDRKGQKLQDNFYILNICVLLDSVVLEQSNFRVIVNDLGYSVVLPGHARPNFRTLREKDILLHHLWREKIDRYDFYLSDALKNAIDRARLKGLHKERTCKVTLV